MRGEGYSLSDIAAATGNGNGGFGGDYGCWWIIIIIILFGWGRNGNWGGNYDSGSNSIPYFQSLDTDFATIERKLDTVNAGICDATYALNNTITNGFAAAQNTMTQGFAGLNTSMVQQGYENRIAVGNVANQLSQCCCDLKQQLSNNMYETAKGFCSTNNTIALSSRDIIDNMNANYRALHDEIVANRIEDKNAQIAAQQNEINALRLSASQCAQNEYLVNTLTDRIVPQARPSYLVPNPNCCYNTCGCNTGCGM